MKDIINNFDSLDFKLPHTVFGWTLDVLHVNDKNTSSPSSFSRISGDANIELGHLPCPLLSKAKIPSSSHYLEVESTAISSENLTFIPCSPMASVDQTLATSNITHTWKPIIIWRHLGVDQAREYIVSLPATTQKAPPSDCPLRSLTPRRLDKRHSTAR